MDSAHSRIGVGMVVDLSVRATDCLAHGVGSMMQTWFRNISRPEKADNGKADGWLCFIEVGVAVGHDVTPVASQRMDKYTSD